MYQSGCCCDLVCMPGKQDILIFCQDKILGFKNYNETDSSKTITQFFLNLDFIFFYRYKATVYKLVWPDVWLWYGNEFQHILRLIDLILTLPASSAENERGFSQMKLTKTNLRTKLKTSTLSNLMTVNLLTPDVDTFNQEAGDLI